MEVQYGALFGRTQFIQNRVLTQKTSVQKCSHSPHNSTAISQGYFKMLNKKNLVFTWAHCGIAMIPLQIIVKYFKTSQASRFVKSTPRSVKTYHRLKAGKGSTDA